MVAKIKRIEDYSRLCTQFVKNENSLDDALREITFDDVRRGVENISNRDTRLILFWIELKRRYEDSKYDEKELKYSFSLEHIMPVRWEENWNFDVVPHPNQSLSLEEMKQDRNRKVRWIGNLTLLKSRLNSSLSNQSFSVKISGEGRKKGIRKYAILSITYDDIVEPFDKGRTNWDESRIEERTEKLAKEIWEIWGSNSNGLF